MRAAQAGDAGAYRRLLGELAGVLRAGVARALARAGRSRDEAEDIVQEALLAIHLKRGAWDPSQPFAPWARAIARYKTVDALRRLRVHAPLDEFMETLEAPAPEPVEGVDIRRLLARLSERARALVVAMAIEGRTAREAAAAQGMSEGAARVALHRALKELGRAYRKGDDGEN